MGRALARSAFSPNIRERLDFSCALFDRSARLLAQAAHIPVHLGSLPDLVEEVANRRTAPGDCWMANSPYRGGTHLPDLTLLLPVHDQKEQRVVGWAVCRAHHADVGGMTAGSMPDSREVYQEGLIVPPSRLLRRGRRQALWGLLLANTRTPRERDGDLRAQLGACELGARRLLELRAAEPDGFDGLCDALLDHSEDQLEALLTPLGSCRSEARELLDWGADRDIALHLALSIENGRATLDFRGSDDAVALPINATRAITCAAAYFPFFCLVRNLQGRVTVNSGSLRRLSVLTRPGSLLHATVPDPVCAGNVETSQRICDLVWSALAPLWPERVPAGSATTMNNLTVGNSRGERPFTYYETCGGGHGGGPQGAGVSGQQVAMTNTRNTPAETLETYYPLRLWRYALRPASGGAGRCAGGEGVERELELLAPAQVSLLATRRRIAPAGRAGGEPGACGADRVDGRPQSAPWQGWMPAGTRLTVGTPGGGGWGKPEAGSRKEPDVSG